ncbi:MAG: DNA mismatch repair endonuclease MutL [Candidatus Latescibacterota bacterium]
MAARIRVLSESVVQKIAAGEVIERPASVVKELAENAVDAGARRVRVELTQGGLQSILVSDDGTGMSRQDAPLSIVRHATSKIAAPSDLFAISTLGFRGEALASIAAVSRLVIETRTADEELGTRVVVEGGITRQVSPLGRAPGTSVWVRGLFFNTPARRKFMRRPEVEARQVSQVLLQLAAASPHVEFQLVHGERLVFSLAAGGRAERAAALLGIPASDLLEARNEEEGIAVHLYLGPVGQGRRMHGRQFMVIRGRPVFAPGLSQALQDAHGGLLSADARCPFLCWCDLDPRRVDVNVHPTKREIRFADEPQVREALRRAARRALGAPETPAWATGPPLAVLGASSVTDGGAGAVREGLGWPSPEPCPAAPDQLDLGLAQGIAGPEVTSCWQLYGRYIVATLAEGLLLVDQQAAHQRVLYEEALAAVAADPIPGQQLLFPNVLPVDPVESQALAAAADLLGQLGFAVREFGPGTVVVEAVPAGLREWGEGQLLRDVLRDFADERRDPGRSLQEAMALAYARRASVRAGTSLAPAEMHDLVQRLLRTREPFVCPGGRRSAVALDERALEALFGRG